MENAYFGAKRRLDRPVLGLIWRLVTWRGLIAAPDGVYPVEARVRSNRRLERTESMISFKAGALRRLHEPGADIFLREVQRLGRLYQQVP